MEGADELGRVDTSEVEDDVAGIGRKGGHVVTAPHPIPMLPGWDVEDHDGLLVAGRKYELSEYAKEWGALDEVSARDAGELWILCDAQTRLAERLATAENCHPRVKPLRGM